MATPIRPHAAAVAAGAAGDDQRRAARERADELLDRMDEQHPRAEPAPRRLARAGGASALMSRRPPGLRRGGELVDEPLGDLAVEPLDLSGPAADAVVTVTLARPNSCSSGPRSVSTVWIRETGAIRRSWSNQPDCV